jgi:hypothetical protein
MAPISARMPAAAIQAGRTLPGSRRLRALRGRGRGPGCRLLLEGARKLGAVALLPRALPGIVSGAALRIAQRPISLVEFCGPATGRTLDRDVRMMAFHQRLVRRLDHDRIGVRQHIQQSVEAVMVTHGACGRGQCPSAGAIAIPARPGWARASRAWAGRAGSG